MSSLGSKDEHCPTPTPTASSRNGWSEDVEGREEASSDMFHPEDERGPRMCRVCAKWHAGWDQSTSEEGSSWPASQSSCSLVDQGQVGSREAELAAP